MKRQPATTSNVTGTLFQVLVVGVLLFAVVWQLSGSIADEPDVIDAAVSRVERRAETFVTTDDVNLRQGPGMDHDVITVVPLHAEVLVTGASQNGFVPVDVGGTSAWVAESYVVPEGSVLGGTTGDLAFAEVVEPTVADPEPTPAPTAVPTEVVAEVVEDAPDTFTPQVAAAEVAVVESDPVSDEAAAPVVASTFAETADVGAAAEPGERWIEVDRSTTTVTLHDGALVVAEFSALIGKDPSTDGFYSTATGTFYVHMKNRELTETPFAPGVFLTDFVGFDHERSNGFHSPTRDAAGTVIQTGGTTTLGCVRLREDDARQLFDFAFVGMRVEIHD